MNVELLRKVKEHILEEPKRLDMDTIGSKRTGRDAPECQTAACIAGWTCVLHFGHDKVSFNENGWLRVNDDADLWSMGKRLLGLTVTQANTLFREPSRSRWDDNGSRYGWPEKFAKKYCTAQTAKTRAEVTAARIEHFIKTEGRE